MKGILITLSTFLLLMAPACQSSSTKTRNITVATDSLINTGGNHVEEAYREGARLIAANDCFTCHAIDKKVVGPSFKDIARKYHHYPGTIDNLQSSIVKGSRGIWGSNQVMTPHPNLSADDARKMIHYIFSLDSTDVNDTTGTRILK
jgi:cytochrome c